MLCTRVEITSQKDYAAIFILIDLVGIQSKYNTRIHSEEVLYFLLLCSLKYTHKTDKEHLRNELTPKEYRKETKNNECVKLHMYI